jgi:LuxR family transcriptional regulator, maltose regulon positive regulatory protein
MNHRHVIAMISCPPPWVLIEPLSRCEMRVLRYLPANLSAPDIARERSVPVTTVRTRIRHLFVKLDAHRI